MGGGILFLNEKIFTEVSRVKTLKGLPTLQFSKKEIGLPALQFSKIKK